MAHQQSFPLLDNNRPSELCQCRNNSIYPNWSPQETARRRNEQRQNNNNHRSPDYHYQQTDGYVAVCQNCHLPAVGQGDSNYYQQPAYRRRNGLDFRMDLKSYCNIRWIGVGLFVIACIFCFYGILVLEKEESPYSPYHKRLKLVSIFSRHGDRSPSDPLPLGDRHKEKFDFFWPNGFGNLTDIGKFRMFQLGLENRRKYNRFLGYDSSKLLAFSSPKPRCQESLRLMLQAMFTMDTTKDQARAQIDELNKATNSSRGLLEGSGTPAEWKKIPIDTETVPALIFEYLNACKYRIEHPSPIDDELTLSPDVKALPGIEDLRKVLMDKYTQKLNYSALDLWSTLASEMTLERTTETIDYTKHYTDWVNRPVGGAKKQNIPLFDLYEQAAVFAYRDRLNGPASYVQSGTILTSLVESQLVALGELNPNDEKNKRAKIYQGKRMVMYSSHDTVLQRLLFDMGVLRTDEGSFEKRFKKLRNSNDDLAKFLAGMKMCSYGISFRVELFEGEIVKTGRKYNYVRMSMYNREDAKFHGFEYQPIEIGSMCRRLFEKQHPKAYAELEAFFDPIMEYDNKYSCPFALFRNVTSHLMVEEKKINELCGLKQ